MSVHGHIFYVGSLGQGEPARISLQSTHALHVVNTSK